MGTGRVVPPMVFAELEVILQVRPLSRVLQVRSLSQRTFVGQPRCNRERSHSAIRSASHIRRTVLNQHLVGNAIETHTPNGRFNLGGALENWIPLGSKSQVSPLHIQHQVPNGRSRLSLGVQWFFSARLTENTSCWVLLTNPQEVCAAQKVHAGLIQRLSPLRNQISQLNSENV